MPEILDLREVTERANMGVSRPFICKAGPDNQRYWVKGPGAGWGHPAEMLLVTRLPEGSGKRRQVASEMVLELDSIEGLQCLPVSEVDEILSFAKQRVMVGVPPFEQT